MINCKCFHKNNKLCILIGRLNCFGYDIIKTDDITNKNIGLLIRSLNYKIKNSYFDKNFSYLVFKDFEFCNKELRIHFKDDKVYIKRI